MKGNTVYCGRRKSTIHVKIGAVANQADRPEKSQSLQLALLGTYDRIASWAADVDHNVLPDCNACHKKRSERISFAGLGSATMDRTCGRCCQWDLTSDSPALKRIKPPELYPKNTDDGAPPAPEGRVVGEKHIIPVEQSFPWLKSCVHYAAYHVNKGMWNKGVMTAYLRTCAISRRVRDHLWHVLKADENNLSPIGENEEYNDDDEIDGGYAPITSGNGDYVPKIWQSQLNINSYVDCGMHLIFHGVLASMVEVLDSVFTDLKLGSKFENSVNAYLLEVESLRLEWCKAKPMPKKQWLVENELALARILPFVYTTFFNSVTLPKNPNMNPDVLKVIYKLIHTLHLLICRLMSPRTQTELEIDNAVKLFLSCCHTFCKMYWKDSVKPFWSRTGNYPTLLCLLR